MSEMIKAVRVTKDRVYFHTHGQIMETSDYIISLWPGSSDVAIPHPTDINDIVIRISPSPVSNVDGLYVAPPSSMVWTFDYVDTVSGVPRFRIWHKVSNRVLCKHPVNPIWVSYIEMSPTLAITESQLWSITEYTGQHWHLESDHFHQRGLIAIKPNASSNLQLWFDGSNGYSYLHEPGQVISAGYMGGNLILHKLINY